MAQVTQPTTSAPKTLCIIVTYNPDVHQLEETLHALAGQVQQIMLIDNHSRNAIVDLLPTRVSAQDIEIHALPRNIGLAAAQNIGLKFALDHQFDRILLLDQDSKPEPNFVAELHKALTTLKSQKAAAVGPQIIDRRSQTGSSASLSSTNVPIRTAFLISSGTLLETHALKHIGEMAEELFIDHVDHEWCFRASALGYTLYQIPDACLFHALGDQVIHFWAIRHRDISIHSALRNYYKVRNSIQLCKLPHVPTRWKIKFMKQAIGVAIFSILVSPDKQRRLTYLYLSLRDGLRSHLGKFHR